MKVHLKDIASFSKGEQINGDQLLTDGLYDYLNGGINPSGKWDDFNVEGDTIAISEGGNSCGYVNYMNDRFWCGGHCYYLYDIKCKPKYLYYILKSRQDSIMKLRSGACMPNIKKKDLGEFTFWYDSDEDYQNKVIELFDILNDIIDKRQRQYSKLDELIKSRFVEMFGDLRTNPYSFIKQKLTDSCDIITGNTPSRVVSEYYGDYIEWIKTDNIVIDQLYPTQAAESLSEDGMYVGRIVDKNSILMSCIARSVSSIGRVCITDRKVAFNQQINAIVPKKYNVFFLYVMLQLSKDYLVEEINMALKGILSKSKLGDKVFIIPPVELQNQFSDFVAKVEQQKAIIQKSIDRLETLKKSLMQEYFDRKGNHDESN